MTAKMAALASLWLGRREVLALARQAGYGSPDRLWAACSPWLRGHPPRAPGWVAELTLLLLSDRYLPHTVEEVIEACIRQPIPDVFAFEPDGCASPEERARVLMTKLLLLPDRVEPYGARGLSSSTLRLQVLARHLGRRI